MEPDRRANVDLDRGYDLRLLTALPSALGLFPRDDLALQLDAMSKRKRAMCFTLLAPVRNTGVSVELSAAYEPRDRASVAVVLVCLHVAPELAGLGAPALLQVLETMTTHEARPLHELSAPMTRIGNAQSAGIYREAIYGGNDFYVAITSHAPAEIPEEVEDIVAQATRGERVDIVTTVAVTPYRPEAASALRHRRPATRPTLH